MKGINATSVKHKEEIELRPIALPSHPPFGRSGSPRVWFRIRRLGNPLNPSHKPTLRFLLNCWKVSIRVVSLCGMLEAHRPASYCLHPHSTLFQSNPKDQFTFLPQSQHLAPDLRDFLRTSA
jgi:hypothetical protein